MPREPIRTNGWLYVCPVCGVTEQDGNAPCVMGVDPDVHPNAPEEVALERRHYVWIDALDHLLAEVDRHRQHHYPGGKITNHADAELYRAAERIMDENTLRDE